MNKNLINNNKIMLIFLEEEEEDDDIIIATETERREKVDALILNRKIEGYFEILIKRHLIRNETKFRQFFHVNKNQFNYLLYLSYLSRYS